MRKGLVLLGGALLLAGCGGTSSKPAAKATAAATTGAPITLTETEFSIAPATVNVPRPGTYVFKAVNKGQVTHALEIEGQGVDAKTGDISPGGSASVRVNLTKGGAYEIYCPIDGHRDKGMKAGLVVGNVTGTPTTGQTTQETSTSSGY